MACFQKVQWAANCDSVLILICSVGTLYRSLIKQWPLVIFIWWPFKISFYFHFYILFLWSLFKGGNHRNTFKDRMCREWEGRREKVPLSVACFFVSLRIWAVTSPSIPRWWGSTTWGRSNLTSRHTELHKVKEMWRSFHESKLVSRAMESVVGVNSCVPCIISSIQRSGFQGPQPVHFISTSVWFFALHNS